MTASLTIRDLRYRYPSAPTPVLNGVDLDLEPGERVALLGPNGSGKTTLALHCNGLLALQSGTIQVGDQLLSNDSLRRIRQRVGLVFQRPDDQLFLSTVGDDVAFGPANLGIPASEQPAVVRQALESVGGAHLVDASPHHLSGGEKRRAALATVLAMQPDLLVLDEPTAGLDPVGVHELAVLLRGLPQTQLIVTHDLPFALHTCPRSVILDHGRVVADRPTEQLLGDADLLAAHRLALPFGWGGG